MLRNDRRQPGDHPLDERVASLLAAAAAPTESGPMPGEDQVLAAYRASQETTGRSLLRSPITPAKTALAAALGAGVLLTGGVAAAATGSLPGAAQDKASEMLTKVGVTVPGADEAAGGNPDQRGSSSTDEAEDTETADESTESGTEGTESTEDAAETTEPTEVDGDGSEDTESHGKGETVREMAKSDDTTGVEKGAAVSGYASGGKSKAGENHQQGKPAKDDADEAEDTDVPAEEPTEGDDEASTGEARSADKRTDGEEKSAEKRTDGQDKSAEKRPASEDTSSD